MHTKRKELLQRIESIEQDILKAEEYLKDGKHPDWIGFKPAFTKKWKDGKELPPHADWVKNTFLPARQRALRRTEKSLKRLESGK